jgi:outer membrane receptor protein involved in Fe transport
MWEGTLSQDMPKHNQLKGTVLDSIQRTPLHYTSVSVFVVGSNSPLATTFTKVDGIFVTQEIAGKEFSVVVSFIGYKSRIFNISVDTSSSTIDLGTILLTPAVNQLKEVKVTAKKKLLEYDQDKITYNVEADPTNKTRQAIDMLRKVPLVTVDADDNLKLKGSSNYKVLINGKESSILARNVKEVLRSMPASTIKSIEVMTVPPARYDAEGIGGIINIKTQKATLEGHNGSVNSSGSIPKGYHLGGYITALISKIGFSGYGGYSLSASPNSRISLTRHDSSQNAHRLVQKGEKDYKGTFLYLGGELSYQYDSLNLITANYNLDVSYGKNYYTYNTQVLSQQKEVQQAFLQKNNIFNEWLATDIGADYQRTFKRNEHQLFTISYKHKANRDNSSSDFRIDSVLNYQSSLNKSNNDGLFRENTFQSDYVHPVKSYLIELGVKGIFRKNKSNYQYEHYAPETQTYVSVDNLSDIFQYWQNIYATYTSLSMNGEKWGFKLGGRFESTSIEANFKSFGKMVEQSFDNLIPNIIVSYQADSSSTLKMAYSQRIERPGLYYLNPYQNIIDPKNISFGNPNLVPSTTNSFELSYNTYRGGNSFNVSLFYNYTNNSIQYYTITGSDAIARSTYGNIGKSRHYGISFSTNITLVEKLNINVNGDGNRIQLSSILNHLNTSNTGYTYNIFAFTSYKLGNDWQLSGNIGYNSASIMLQGKSAPYTYHSFAINKEFLKENKASLGFNVSNPFQKERRWYNETEDNNFYQLQESYVLNRWFSLAFNYRFGKLKEDIVRKKRGIENDDIKAIEKKSEGN